MARAHLPEVRGAILGLYALVVVALIAAFALVAVALEVLVMPRHVYSPIKRMRDADLAVRDGRRDHELIPDDLIPSDELGEIMRSRNESIRSLRHHESALARAFEQIEEVASDLKRKNHLLERAQQNLRDADRLASLGMMSAGIAHELNTPLSVIKGLAERLDQDPSHSLRPEQASLLLRVVRRLERLSESLLDFARVRPPQSVYSRLASIIDESFTLVRLDRDARGIDLMNEIDPGLAVHCDPDRLVQVFVNIVRNSVDAMRRADSSAIPRVVVRASVIPREESTWISVLLEDTGPGIDPAVLPRLFEPFMSTNLDAKGTGLGLAVAEGIVREHGGVILARNRRDRSGAQFEILLPMASTDAGPIQQEHSHVGRD